MVTTADDAYAAATRAYLAGRRVDMRELATDLGVARTTLYRWTGDRDQLLTDVIWSLSETLIDDVWARTARRRGVNRLVEALRLYLTAIVESRALHAFLQNETYAALRLLTARGPFQDRLVAAVKRLALEEQARGTFTPPADPDLLAYGIVRLMEGFVYNDAIIEREPAIDEAMAMVRLVLA